MVRARSSTIFNHAKIVLNDQGLGIKTALPSVVSGKDHSLLSINQGSPSVGVLFEISAGNFSVIIYLSE